MAPLLVGMLFLCNIGAVHAAKEEAYYCTCQLEITGSEDPNGDPTIGACTDTFGLPGNIPVKDTANFGWIQYQLGPLETDQKEINLGGTLNQGYAQFLVQKKNCFPIKFRDENGVVRQTLDNRPLVLGKSFCEGGMAFIGKETYSRLARFNGDIDGHNYDGYYNVSFRECKFEKLLLSNIPDPSEKKDESDQTTQPNLTGGFTFPGSLAKVPAQSLDKFIGRGINGSLLTMGSIALIMFIYGGVLYMTAGGNQNREHKALLTLAWTGIGIVTILSSYVIVQFIFEAFK